MEDQGRLFIVPTPIGNLEDMSQRAIRVLGEVDLIAAEDTRHTHKLLDHYGISTRTYALHDHNEKQRASHLISRLNEGTDMALVSDAGTPLISDPGYTLVNQCREQGITVIPLPGPCAAITALSAAGLATDRFIFEGFLPVKQVAKHEQLATLTEQTATAVFYEAPRRIEDTIRCVIEVLGPQRDLVIAKELTKAFETFFAGTAEHALQWLMADPNHQRGEFVLMVAGNKDAKGDTPPEALNLLDALTEELPLKKAAAIVAKHYDLKKNALYQIGLERQQNNS